MEQISEQRLSVAPVALSRAVRAAHDKMFAATGKGFRVAECNRSYAESDADFAKGRTAPGPKVTNAPGGFSWHNFDLAVDCYPFTEADSGALDWNASDPEFKAMVGYLKAEGLAWGGDWQSIKDFPHFQLSTIPASPNVGDRIAYAKGGVKAVWEQRKVA